MSAHGELLGRAHICPEIIGLARKNKSAREAVGSEPTTEVRNRKCGRTQATKGRMGWTVSRSLGRSATTIPKAEASATVPHRGRSVRRLASIPTDSPESRLEHRSGPDGGGVHDIWTSIGESVPTTVSDRLYALQD